MRLYFNRKFKSKFAVKRYYNGILIEQDSDSPHRYTTPSFCPDRDDILIDVGGAEGFFPIDYIDKVKKIYIFECDPEWVHALKYTYKDYKEKVEIIEQYVSDSTTKTQTTLDDFIKKNHLEKESLFIKIDAEGSEPLIINGAERVLSENPFIKIAVCTYHSAKHEQFFRNKFKDCYIENSNGYMFCLADYNICEPYLRRGVLRIAVDNVRD